MEREYVGKKRPMASPEGARKWFEPLEGGPWLTDRSTTGFCLRLSLWCFVAACGVGVLGTLTAKGGAAVGSGSHTLGLLALLLFFISGGTFLGSFATLGNQRLMQFCPDCLKSMDLGAYVCPYCGFRETLRKEHP